MSVHRSMLTRFGCWHGRTSRVKNGEEFAWALSAALEQYVAAATFPRLSFYLPNIRGVSFSLHFKPNQSPSKVTASRVVLSYRESGHKHTHIHTPLESCQHKSAKTSRQGLSTETLSPTASIWMNRHHIRSDIYSHRFTALIESLLRDTNTNHRKCSINTTWSKWYPSSGWPHSASAGTDQIS